MLNPSQSSENTKNISLEKSRQALKTAIELRKIMEGVERETNELNMFARMWVKRIFKQRTGITIEDWITIIKELIAELRAIINETEECETRKSNTLRNKLNWLNLHLAKLAENFKQNKKDVESFIKDPKALEKVRKVLDYRENTVRILISILEKIEG